MTTHLQSNMNRTDTLESGRSNNFGLQDMPQVQSPRSPIVIPNSKRNFRDLARSFFNFLPDESGWVRHTVEQYVSACVNSGEHEWSEYIEKKLKDFGKLQFKTQYKLNITSIDYPVTQDTNIQPSSATPGQQVFITLN